MKAMKLVRYEPEHLEPMLALHRRAKLGLDTGMSDYDEEADLRAVEQ